MNKKVLLSIASTSIVGVVSYIIGYNKGKHIVSSNCSGTLRIDNSEKDENSRMFLELDEDICTIANKKVIKLNVLNKNYVTH